MNDTISHLPENIQDAINSHVSAKQIFIEKKSSYQAVFSKVEKHRKTALAARLESSQAAESWRDLLRKSDGALTKEINSLRQKETDSNTLAEEFDKLALETEAILQQNGQEAYDAYLDHSHAYKLATSLYDETIAERAIQELLALPQAKTLAWFLKAKTKANQNRLQDTYGIQVTAQGQKDYLMTATQETAAFLLGLFEGLVKDLPESYGYDDIRKTLSLEPLSPINANQFKPKTATQRHKERFIVK